MIQSSVRLDGKQAIHKHLSLHDWSSLEPSRGLPRLPARHALRTAVFAIDFADGGRGGTTLTSGQMRHNSSEEYAASHLAASESFGQHLYPSSGMDCSGHRTTVWLRRAPMKLNPLSWHSDPEGDFQPERAALRVLQGWRRSELPASQVLYEGVTQDPVLTFGGSQLLRSSS